MSIHCFVIMPISDPDGYEKGHFKKVYEDIFKVACNKAGFSAIRADDVKQTNLIHLDILEKLIASPIAICDLSDRNPNVLFELGLRQAFDKPTVLVQEEGTPKIFDISPLRLTNYRKELKYREVLEDQDFIAEALKATKEATDKGEGVNSLISLLSLTSPASLKDVTDNDAAKMLQIVISQMNDLKADFSKTLRKSDEQELVKDELDYSPERGYSKIEGLLKEIKTLVQNRAPIKSVQDAYNSMEDIALRIQNSTPAYYSTGFWRSIRLMKEEAKNLMNSVKSGDTNQT